jgi:hypothetical protein
MVSKPLVGGSLHNIAIIRAEFIHEASPKAAVDKTV